MNDTTTRPTTVLNVSRLTRDQRAALTADPTFVYVGRKFAGWPASVYGNPFKPGMPARDAWAIINRSCVNIVVHVNLSGPLSVDQAVECYRLIWTATRARRDKIRAELRSCSLGCWCVPAPCHATELAKIADSTEPNDVA